MIKKFCILALVILLLPVGLADGEETAKVKSAVSAAEKWLETVDKGSYGDSWVEASEYFKKAISQQEWEHSMKAFRKPFGDLISRKMTSAVYRTSIPGAPDGEYVVIQFESSFKNKKEAIETVTPMLDKEHVWRVSGYYIK